VHDIGKNIVGVVMQCNNYEVIDAGVMTPCSTILDTAEKEKADIVGLSGLITPSLEEMVSVAKEMERRGMKIPLLLGGATTSAVHTAVKIAPCYSGVAAHVKDASLAIPVINSLMNPARSASFIAGVKDSQREIREKRGESKAQLISYAGAVKNKFVLPPFEKAGKPAFTGVKTPVFSIDQIAPWIDWRYFLHAWSVKGASSADGDKAKEAESLLKDAQKMLGKISSEKLTEPRAVFGIFPANSSGDDVIVHRDVARMEPLASLCFLRQQMLKTDGPNFSLADFIAPDGNDYIGAFVTTAGPGAHELAEKFRREGDDYNSIMAGVLADRIAEALAELLHERVRKEFWGYAADEKLSMDEIFAGKYRGIRPAPGYPACPDHSEKLKIFSLLNAEKNTGVTLTETCMMIPASSVCGLYFASPSARYFNVGSVVRDQLESYAKRKDLSLPAAEKLFV
jgi:5-methyltetrahydrofolate--homocysteine methyltransferase